MRSPGSKLHLPRLELPPLRHLEDHPHPHLHPGDLLLRLPPDHLPGNQFNLPDRLPDSRLNLPDNLPEDLLQLGVPLNPAQMSDALIPIRLKPGFPTFPFSPSGNNWVEMVAVPTTTFLAQPGPVLKFPNDWCPTNLQWKTTDLGLVYLISQQFRHLHLLHAPDNLRFKLLLNAPDNRKFKLLPNAPDNLKLKLLNNNNDPDNNNPK